MTLELDGNSRAAAERQANQMGVDVLHVEDLTPPEQRPHSSRHRGEAEPTRHLPRILLWLVVGLLVVLGIVFWSKLRALWSDL
jgi:hypothetical protein